MAAGTEWGGMQGSDCVSVATENSVCLHLMGQSQQPNATVEGGGRREGEGVCGYHTQQILH